VEELFPAGEAEAGQCWRATRPRNIPPKLMPMSSRASVMTRPGVIALDRVHRTSFPYASENSGSPAAIRQSD